MLEGWFRCQSCKHSQKDDGLVLRTMSKTRVGSEGEILGGLVGTSLLAAVDTQAGICACVDGDNSLGREGGDGKMCVVAAGKGRSQARVVLLVLGQRWQRGVLQRIGSHDGQPRPRGSE